MRSTAVETSPTLWLMKTSTIHEAEDKVQANDSLSTGQDSEGDLSV